MLATERQAPALRAPPQEGTVRSIVTMRPSFMVMRARMMVGWEVLIDAAAMRAVKGAVRSAVR